MLTQLDGSESPRYYASDSLVLVESRGPRTVGRSEHSGTINQTLSSVDICRALSQKYAGRDDDASLDEEMKLGSVPEPRKNRRRRHWTDRPELGQQAPSSTEPQITRCI